MFKFLKGSTSSPGARQLLLKQIQDFQKRTLITLGENQKERVKPTAEQLGAKEISKDWPAELPTMNPDGTRLSKEQIQKNKDYNKKWIQDQIQQGEDAIDIGKDPGRKGPGISTFLALERQALKDAKYTNAPVEKWTGKDGQDYPLPKGSTYWKPPEDKQ